MNKTPTTLIIMDGFGLTNPASGNAIRAAKTPRLDQFFQEFAHTQLQASGLDVGLPEGQMGNSEVGHTNIGAGRWCSRTCPASPSPFRMATSFQNPAYCHAMDACLEKGHVPAPDGPSVRRRRPLPPDPPVRPAENGQGAGALEKVYIHAFLDGRDVSPPPAWTLWPGPWNSAAGSAWARSPRSWAATTPWTGTSAGTGWSRPMTPWSMGEALCSIPCRWPR